MVATKEFAQNSEQLLRDGVYRTKVGGKTIKSVQYTTVIRWMSAQSLITFYQPLRFRFWKLQKHCLVVLSWGTQSAPRLGQRRLHWENLWRRVKLGSQYVFGGYFGVPQLLIRRVNGLGRSFYNTIEVSLFRRNNPRRDWTEGAEVTGFNGCSRVRKTMKVLCLLQSPVTLDLLVGWTWL